MKKRQMTIEEYKNILGAHTIIINNVRYQKAFPSIVEKIIKQFLVDEEIFFGFCRTDGVNLVSEQQMKLKSEIPLFFNKNGDIQKLSEYLTVARINLRNRDYSFIPLIFDYYLETIMFNPKVDWEKFKQYHYNYQEHRFDDIVLKHFAEILFCYLDSGDFLICFNPQMYNPGDVRNIVVKILQG
ncbi:MAG: hypothetical protein IJF80_04120 [Clostridia bacterium]|nr:hypothetical protein [Clostridia bacterium]